MNPHKPLRRRSTNLSLDPTLVGEAKALGVNVSRACESGLLAELKAARNKQWADENSEAIEGWNAWVAKHGLPLAKYRQF